MARKFISLGQLARKCGINIGVLGKQVRRGAYGNIPLAGKLNVQTLVPAEHAKRIVVFNATHTVLEKAARKLRRNNKLLKRGVEVLRKLGDAHPVTVKIGGSVEMVDKGGFHYIPNAHLPRLKSFLNDFISIEEAARRLRIPKGKLFRHLWAGHWPQAIFTRLNPTSNLVHTDVLGAFREFKQTHYTHKQAIRRAGVQPSVFNNWIAHWNFPTKAFSARERHVPKAGFDELVEAFKEGKQSAKLALQEWKRQYSRNAFSKQFAREELGLREESAVDAALKLLNKQCANLAEQERVISIVKSLDSRREKEASEGARHLFVRLAAESGGLNSELGLQLQTIAKSNHIIDIHNALVAAGNVGPHNRKKILNETPAFLQGKDMERLEKR